MTLERVPGRDASVGAAVLADFREAILDLSGADFMAASRFAERQSRSVARVTRYKNSESRYAIQSSLSPELLIKVLQGNHR